MAALSRDVRRSLQAQKIGLKAYEHMLLGMAERMEELEQNDLSEWALTQRTVVQMMIDEIERRQK